ncbi:zinc finger protein 91-like [Lucilia sericata]|uniref:zinc finger protein 91-like n=1 Tax=Lucilia sericata TaxID=13632 RepID=UPI0018A86F60|nr:zinc finger protein 91-like [Lucilia sericata]
MLIIEIYGRVCRVCMCKSNNLHSLNDSTEECLTMNEMLTKTVSGIHANIEFPVPQEICDLCMEHLQIAYRFQQLCMNTNEQMQKIWEQSQKAEVKQQSLTGEAENEEDEPDPIKVEYDMVEGEEQKFDNVEMLEDFENVENGQKWENDTDEAPDRDELACQDTSLKSSSSSSGRLGATRFSCLECKESFAKHSQLKRHRRKHESTHPFDCQKCTQRFKSKSLLAKHSKSCKKDKCPMVGKSDSEDEDDEDDDDVPLSTLKKTESDNESDVSKENNKKKQKSLKSEKKTPYHCSKCNSYFKYSYQQTKHRCSDEDNEGHKCEVCNKTFSTENMLKKHMSSKHKDKKNKTEKKTLDKSKVSDEEDGDEEFKPEEVDMDQDNDNWNDQGESSDDSDSDYAEKEKTAAKAKPEPLENQYKCKECFASFRFEKQLARHMKKHTEAHRFICVLCWDRFKYPHMLQKHMQKHHPEDNPNPKVAETKPENVEKTHVCSYCPSAYSNVGGLAQHMSKKHPEIKPFKCDKCDKTFVVEEHLKIHTNRHMGIKNFKCDLCDKSFSFKFAMKQHMRIHTGDLNYLCTLCGKKFYRPSNLRQHMQRHGDDKPYTCPHCPKRFKCPSDRYIHLMSHQEGKNHVCQTCGARFSRVDTLHQHQILHTGEKRYKCDQCPMAFPRLMNLNRHLRTHTGEKPYKCKFCEKAYAQSNDLNKHLRTHVGENTYMCTQCPAAYKYQADLRNHEWEHYRLQKEAEQKAKDEATALKTKEEQTVMEVNVYNKELENIWKLQEQERSQENITEDVPDVKVKEELSRTSNKGPTKDIEKPNESDAEDNSSSEYSWPILEEYGVESCTDISSTQASEDTKLEIENSNENEDTSSSEDSWAFQDKNNSESSSSENDTTASPPTKKTLLTKHLANEFACHMCSYRFSTERKLMNHLIWIHKFKASNLHKGHYDCEYCSFKFYEKMEWANHDFCRTCLKPSENMQNLSNLLENGTKIEDILKQTIPSFELKMVGLQLPEEICKSCLNKLKESFNFIQMCQENNKELQNLWKLQEQEIKRSPKDFTQNILEVNFTPELNEEIYFTVNLDVGTPQVIEEITVETENPNNSSSENNTTVSSTTSSEDTVDELACHMCSYRFSTERNLKYHLIGTHKFKAKMASLPIVSVCRTCLKHSKNMPKLSDLFENGKKIEDILKQTIPEFVVKIGGLPLPEEICKQCLNKLKKSHDFVQTYHKSNKELQNIWKQQMENVESSTEDIPKDILEINFKPELEEVISFTVTTDISSTQAFEEIKLEMEQLNESQKENISNSELYRPFQDKNDNESRNSAINPAQAFEEAKLEIEEAHESQMEKNISSSEECRPFQDKNNGESSSSENDITDSPTTKKTKRIYRQKATTKRSNTKTCLHCNEKFSSRTHLTKHLDVHDPVYEFACHLCSYRYSTERKLKNHLKWTHKIKARHLDKGHYVCEYCSIKFYEKIEWSNHDCMKIKRNRKLCSFYFDDCPRKNQNGKGTYDELKTHMDVKYPAELDFKCPTCEQTFSEEIQLKYHINEHMGYKKLTCNLCEKTFITSLALRDHKVNHAGKEQFLCPHCGKSFKTANILRLHVLRHGERKYSCAECPMKFYVQSKLNEHMSVHTKLKPYVCNICDKTFARPSSLKAHKFIHTGKRPFLCDLCNISFAFKRHLKRHKITHTGEKPYACTYCDRAYASSGDLVKHLRSHVGEKTYFCDQCPEAFKYSIELKDHKLKHYKENLQENND